VLLYDDLVVDPEVWIRSRESWVRSGVDWEGFKVDAGLLVAFNIESCLVG